LGILIFGGVGVAVALTMVLDPGGGAVALVFGGAAVIASAFMVALGVISIVRLRRRSGG